MHNINKHISYNIIQSFLDWVVGAILFYRFYFSFFLSKNSTRFHPQITCGLKVFFDAAAVCKYKLRVVPHIFIALVIIIYLPVTSVQVLLIVWDVFCVLHLSVFPLVMYFHDSECKAMFSHGKLMLSSLLLQFYWQSGTGNAHANHKTFYSPLVNHSLENL